VSELDSSADGAERRVRNNAPHLGTPLAFAVPRGFPQPELPADNPLTVEGVALGEFLFNDRRLSARASQSCANCHRGAARVFDGQAFSTGADRVQGTRSSMPLFNLAWSPAYTWDGGKRASAIRRSQR